MDTIANRKTESAPASLVISVEKRGTRNLIVSIRGSTVGVLVALAILAAAAWLLVR